MKRPRISDSISPSMGDGLGMDVPELRQARALWQRNRFDESVQLFEKAVQKYPQNRLPVIHARRELGARFEIARAEALLDRLFTLAGRDAQVLHLAGQSYRMIFRPDKAIECFRRALTLNRNIPDALLELAVLYERRHRLDEASGSIEDCLRFAPDYAEAKLIKARLLRRKKDEAGAETIWRELTGDESVHSLVRAQAWTEIAQACDRHGDYDGAMQATLCGKEILLREEAPIRRESDVILHILRTLAEAVTPADFERWTGITGGFKRSKLALLTSFPRSGT